MKIWPFALAVPLAAMLLLAAMAYASPPDPIWLAGWFDDDDRDDVMALITSGTGTIDPFPLDAVSPVLPRIRAIALAENTTAPTPALCAGDARAPPDLA